MKAAKQRLLVAIVAASQAVQDAHDIARATGEQEIAALLHSVALQITGIVSAIGRQVGN